MYFVIDCPDKPDDQQLRLDTRDAHLAFLQQYKDRIVAGGPTLAEGGGSLTDSLLIMQFADRAEAERFPAEDP